MFRGVETERKAHKNPGLYRPPQHITSYTSGRSPGWRVILPTPSRTWMYSGRLSGLTRSPLRGQHQICC